MAAAGTGAGDVTEGEAGAGGCVAASTVPAPARIRGGEGSVDLEIVDLGRGREGRGRRAPALPAAAAWRAPPGASSITPIVLQKIGFLAES